MMSFSMGQQVKNDRATQSKHPVTHRDKKRGGDSIGFGGWYCMNRKE